MPRQRDIIWQMQTSSTQWAPSVGSMTRRAAAFLIAALLACVPAARAGNMDAIGYFILGIYVYVGIAIALSVFGVIACKRIKSPWRRAAARLLVVVAVYTPVPHAGVYQEVLLQPALLAVVGNHSSWPNSGWLSHPFLMAYSGALLLGLPVVMLWTYVSNRYSRP